MGCGASTATPVGGPAHISVPPQLMARRRGPGSVVSGMDSAATTTTKTPRSLSESGDHGPPPPRAAIALPVSLAVPAESTEGAARARVAAASQLARRRHEAEATRLRKLDVASESALPPATALLLSALLQGDADETGAATQTHAQTLKQTQARGEGAGDVRQEAVRRQGEEEPEGKEKQVEERKKSTGKSRGATYLSPVKPRSVRPPAGPRASDSTGSGARDVTDWDVTDQNLTAKDGTDSVVRLRSHLPPLVRLGGEGESVLPAGSLSPRGLVSPRVTAPRTPGSNARARGARGGPLRLAEPSDAASSLVAAAESDPVPRPRPVQSPWRQRSRSGALPHHAAPTPAPLESSAVTSQDKENAPQESAASPAAPLLMLPMVGLAVKAGEPSVNGGSALAEQANARTPLAPLTASRQPLASQQLSLTASLTFKPKTSFPSRSAATGTATVPGVLPLQLVLETTPKPPSADATSVFPAGSGEAKPARRTRTRAAVSTQRTLSPSLRIGGPAAAAAATADGVTPPFSAPSPVTGTRNAFFGTDAFGRLSRAELVQADEALRHRLWMQWDVGGKGYLSSADIRTAARHCINKALAIFVDSYVQGRSGSTANTATEAEIRKAVRAERGYLFPAIPVRKSGGAAAASAKQGSSHPYLCDEASEPPELASVTAFLQAHLAVAAKETSGGAAAGAEERVSRRAFLLRWNSAAGKLFRDSGVARGTASGATSDQDGCSIA